MPLPPILSFLPLSSISHVVSGVAAVMVEDLREGGRSQEDKVGPARAALCPLVEEEVPQRLSQEPPHQSAVALHQTFTGIGTIGTFATHADIMCPVTILSHCS